MIFEIWQPQNHVSRVVQDIGNTLSNEVDMLSCILKLGMEEMMMTAENDPGSDHGLCWDLFALLHPC